MREMIVPVFVMEDPDPTLLVYKQIGMFELDEKYDPDIRKMFADVMAIEVHDHPIEVYDDYSDGFRSSHPSYPFDTLAMSIKVDRIFTDKLGLCYSTGPGIEMSYKDMVVSHQRAMIITEDQWETLFDFPQFEPIDHKPVIFNNKTTAVDEALRGTGVFRDMVWGADGKGGGGGGIIPGHFLDATTYDTKFEGSCEPFRKRTSTDSAVNKLLDEADKPTPSTALYKEAKRVIRSDEEDKELLGYTLKDLAIDPHFVTPDSTLTMKHLTDMIDKRKKRIQHQRYIATFHTAR